MVFSWLVSVGDGLGVGGLPRVFLRAPDGAAPLSAFILRSAGGCPRLGGCPRMASVGSPPPSFPPARLLQFVNYVYLQWHRPLYIYSGLWHYIYTMACAIVYIQWPVPMCIYSGTGHCKYTVACGIIYIQWPVPLYIYSGL